jgi:hypothetical protein
MCFQHEPIDCLGSTYSTMLSSSVAIPQRAGDGDVGSQLTIENHQ